MNRHVLVVLILVTLAACGTPQRRPGQSPMHHKIEVLFKAADTDGDEWLTPAELDAGFPWLAGKFLEIDTDHNDKVSLAEVTSYIELQSMQPAPKKKP